MSDDGPPIPPEGMTYYQLLGVDEDADEGDIERSYRMLIRIYHPDQFDHPDAGEIIQRFLEAHRVLTAPRKRQQYDRQGHEMYTGEVATWTPPTEDQIDDYNLELEFDGTDLDPPMWVHGTGEISNSDIAEDGKLPETEDGEIDFGKLFETEDSFDDQHIEQIDVEDNDDGDMYERHAEQVKAQYKSRGPKQRTSQKTTEKTKEENESDETANTSTSSETGPTLSERFKNSCSSCQKSIEGVIGFVGQFFSDDTVSYAVRRAWIARVSITVVAFAGLLTLGELASMAGLTFLPDYSTPATDPVSVLPILIGILVVVFIGDQFKTEKGASRGSINMATKPRKTAHLGALLSILGVGVAGYGLVQGGDSWNVARSVMSGFPLAETFIWVPESAGGTQLIGGLNVGVALAMSFLALSGLAIGLPALSRQVWYDRYCNGHYMMPVLWDLIIAIPVVSYFWVWYTGIETVPMPESILAVIAPNLGQYSSAVGITSTTMTAEGLWWVVITLPITVGFIILCWHAFESGLKYIMEDS